MTTPPGRYPDLDLTGMRRGRDRSGAAARNGIAMTLLGIFFLLSLVVVVPEIMADRVGAGEATTHGTVVDLHVTTGRSGSRLCVPVARFEVDATTYTTRTGRSSSSCPSIGSSVTVVYPTADPSGARVPPPAGTRLLLGVVPVVGLVLVVLGIRAFVVRLRRPIA
ncbi:DUF3592 domain-containing protein [Cellulomonas sp. Leaf334]|uniref:DUF3592 domain-containing protein n=1 Tax=Cellulomonas sp. Leaf334 TaxID=1736339 RepID=UPI0006FC2523|nr:DUF3592 domain-containing protein [Cellulomonas sp. Leaf334]KQR08560.1 hypothetical protein ASF78_20165 [Cellulomonas sp. Leaf334]